MIAEKADPCATSTAKIGFLVRFFWMCSAPAAVIILTFIIACRFSSQILLLSCLYWIVVTAFFFTWFRDRQRLQGTSISIETRVLKRWNGAMVKTVLCTLPMWVAGAFCRFI